MPDSIVIMRAALLLGLIAATVALLVWLMRPKARREMDDAAMIPWREEERPPRPPGPPQRANGP
jgi:cbb3-type cytochrome oxidase subunit 3